MTLPFWYMYWASIIYLIQNDQNNGRFKININLCFKRYKRSIVVGILIILVIVIIASVVASVTSNARTKGKFHFNKIDEVLMISLYVKSLWFLLMIWLRTKSVDCSELLYLIHFIYLFNKTLNQLMYDQSNGISIYY